MSKRAAKSKLPVLARQGDPYITADGLEVSPEPLEGEAPEEASSVNARSFRATKKRTIKELPTNPTMMNAIACVFMYTLMGVGDREVALALNITADQLKTVRHNVAYKECFESVLSEVINANSNLLQARLAAYAEDAVDNIKEIASEQTVNGQKIKPDTRLRANVDIADRAGITAKSAENRGSLRMNDLQIIIVKPGEDTEVKISAPM